MRKYEKLIQETEESRAGFHDTSYLDVRLALALKEVLREKDRLQETSDDFMKRAVDAEMRLSDIVEQMKHWAASVSDAEVAAMDSEGREQVLLSLANRLLDILER